MRPVLTAAVDPIGSVGGQEAVGFFLRFADFLSALGEVRLREVFYSPPLRTAQEVRGGTHTPPPIHLRNLEAIYFVSLFRVCIPSPVSSRHLL